MNKQELQEKYKEIVLQTNGGNDDYVVALCKISNAIDELEDAKDLQSQLNQQKAMWENLKEYISSQIIHYDKLSDTFRKEKNNGCVLLSLTKRQVIEEVLYKMQALEKGEKDE